MPKPFDFILWNFRSQILKNKLRVSSYLQLMKPSIMLLVLLTGSASLVLEGSVMKMPWPQNIIRLSLVLLALILTGGSANAFNMYLERDIDSRMTRTRIKRPLPLGKIKPTNALVFAIIIGMAGVSIFTAYFNLFSAMLALATIIFYSFFYTLFLKPRTPYNIVIGGIAGAMTPIITWAAVTGTISLMPLILFTLVFLWTPPHFWALALHVKSDYELINYPMMPVAHGDEASRKQILSYILILVSFSVFCSTIGLGLIFSLIASVIGGIFIYKAVLLLRSHTNDMALGLFRYSILYLCVLFGGIIILAVS